MLFKDSATLKQYAQLTGDINFASLKSTLRFVEIVHLTAHLGKDLYRSLETAYTTNETGMTDAQKALLEACRQLVAPYLVYYYAPKADVQLTDGGITKNKDAAFQYQATSFREANLREAELCEEQLLQFLEDNKDDYPEWVASDAFKDYRAVFIKSGNDFEKLFSSASPCRNYRAMRSKMVDVEEQMIRMAIGDTLFDSLKAKDTGEQDFTEKEKELLFKLKKAIAYQTVALSIPLLNVRIDANGLTVVATTHRSSRDEDAMRSGAGETALSTLLETCVAGAKMWLKNATDYLEKYAADFSWSQANPKDICSINQDLQASFGLF